MYERVNDITFLGIRISAKLSWNIHIDVICKKQSSSDNWPDSQEFSLSSRTSSSHPVHNPGSSNPGVQLRYIAPSQQDLNQPFRVRTEVCLPSHTAVLELGTWWSSFFPPSKLVVTAQLWFRSSKFLPVSLQLPISLFLTLVQIQDVTIHVCSTSVLVALRSVKEASFILGLNFGISCLKMLRLVSLCLLSRLLPGLSSWSSCLLCYFVCLFILVSWVSLPCRSHRQGIVFFSFLLVSSFFFLLLLLSSFFFLATRLFHIFPYIRFWPNLVKVTGTLTTTHAQKVVGSGVMMGSLGSNT